MLDDRQADVRIGRRVAMTGEMLRGCDHPPILHTADVRPGHAGDELNVLSKRPDVDDRIARVVVDVDNRIEVDGDSERPALFGGNPARAIREI
jgi:hypothetical protein